jgi:hypothetical protein
MSSQDISNLQKELKQLHDSLNALKEIKINKPISPMSSTVFSSREAAKASAPFRPEATKALSTEEVEKLVINESDMVDYIENLVSKNLDDSIGKMLGG